MSPLDESKLVRCSGTRQEPPRIKCHCPQWSADQERSRCSKIDTFKLKFATAHFSRVWRRKVLDKRKDWVDKGKNYVCRSKGEKLRLLCKLSSDVNGGSCSGAVLLPVFSVQLTHIFEPAWILLHGTITQLFLIKYKCMLFNHSTLERERFKEVINRPKLARWVYVNFWPQYESGSNLFSFSLNV